jgi:hypothetical protein
MAQNVGKLMVSLMNLTEPSEKPQDGRPAERESSLSPAAECLLVTKKHFVL